ncbi:MAG: ATP-binding cassette domain-containing protein [Oscillospiraceae bacterium]
MFPQKELEYLELGPITVFYGGNGSGKTTLLNVIAEKLHVMRHSAFSGSAFSLIMFRCVVPRQRKFLKTVKY